MCFRQLECNCTRLLPVLSESLPAVNAGDEAVGSFVLTLAQLFLPDKKKVLSKALSNEASAVYARTQLGKTYREVVGKLVESNSSPIK